MEDTAGIVARGIGGRVLDASPGVQPVHLELVGGADLRPLARVIDGLRGLPEGVTVLALGIGDSVEVRGAVAEHWILVVWKKNDD